MSFPKYDRYKDSGVEWLGEVPEHWDVKRLRFIAMLNPSKSEVSKFDRETVISFLPMEAIGIDGTINLEHEKAISEVETGYTFFREGDVTIAKITPCFENGKGAVMKGLLNGIGFGTTELIVARPETDQTFSEYLHWIFTSAPFRNLGESYMYGAGGQKRVPDDFVQNFSLGLPPLPEQRSIAAFLDRETTKIDELIAEQRQLIDLLKEKRQAVISHSVTKGLNPDAPMKDSAIEWLGEVPEHWEVRALRTLSNVVRGASPRPAGDPRFFGGESVPWVTVAEITKDDLSELVQTEEFLTEDGAQNSRRFRKGTLIYSNSGATLGVPKILQIDACANDGVVGFEKLNSEINIFFFYYFLGSITDSIREKVKQGSGQPNLNTDIVKAIRLALPPVCEQKFIVEHIEKMLSEFGFLISETHHAIALLRERRTALISAAVTGKIDVCSLV